MHLNENRNDKNINKSSSLSGWCLLQMNAPEWKRTLMGCFGAISSGAIQPIYAYCMRIVASVYFLKDSSKLKSEIKLYSLIFLGLAVASFFANLLQHYNFAIMGERLVNRVREKILAKVLTFEIGWFDQDENSSAAICARLSTEASTFRSFIADRMSLLVQVFFSASLAILFSLIVTWRIAIVMIAFQPLLIGSFYSRSVLMRSMSEKAQKAQNEGSQLASEAIVNHRTITAFSSQKKILHLFVETMRGPRQQSIKQGYISGFGLFSSQFLTTSSISLTFWYGGRLITQGLLTPKYLFQAFFILMSTGQNIANIGSKTSDLAKCGCAIKRIFAILDWRSEIEPHEDGKGIEVEESNKGEIELKDVFFAYPARPNQMIFKGLCLKIKASKMLALVGQNGYDIKSYKLRNLRSHIALVSQEPTLFAGTIRQNIVYGKVEAKEAEIRKAAILANAHEFISSMKDGYETYCGERGVKLSGGQKQRIALARAILKTPMILLLDEATSALDNSIAVLKNGKVVEQGSHSNLLEGYELQGFLEGTLPAPPRFVTSPDGVLTPNLDASVFNQQDKLLASWLLPIISLSLLSCFTSAKSTCEIWSTANCLFAASTGAKLSRIKHDLHSTKKAFGSAVSEAEKVEVILVGLSTDFDAVLTLASFSTEPLPFQRLVDILMEFESQQTRAEREVSMHTDLVETHLVATMADSNRQETRGGCSVADSSGLVFDHKHSVKYAVALVIWCNDASTGLIETTVALTQFANWLHRATPSFAYTYINGDGNNVGYVNELYGVNGSIDGPNFGSLNIAHGPYDRPSCRRGIGSDFKCRFERDIGQQHVGVSAKVRGLTVAGQSLRPTLLRGQNSGSIKAGPNYGQNSLGPSANYVDFKGCM
ncbi:hypothetical protein PVK06_005015 [Gossypium arboreum]|uniref:Uncharacterized protein n=1 Tax=Gossypium arboreum TaxID=29729 RepID=A0ABR0QTI3_GOSAR|nr:hypothetical protein PVK06_005015 [Gossypium arboreum]